MVGGNYFVCVGEFLTANEEAKGCIDGGRT
jgi:hypothetical protein